MKWNGMRRNYSVMHISLFHCSSTIVKCVLLSVWRFSHNSAWVEQFWHGTYRSLAVMTIHKQPFPVPHYCALTDSQLLPRQPNQTICHKVQLFSTTVPPHMTHIKHNSCCSSFTAHLWMGPSTVFFYVLLTVHLSIILATDQLNAQILVL